MTAQELAENMDSPSWRLSNLYKIITKGDDDDSEGLVVQFKPNRAQRRLLSRLWHRNIILKARQLGFCLHPSTRVLTADLRWVPIAELSEGDKVVSVDEHAAGGKGQARRMRTATVQAVVNVHRKAYRITFDDGRSVVCTGQHPWLSRKTNSQSTWRAIEEREGLVGRLKVGTLVRWVTKPWDEPDFEDGWMGGMLDGEGSISKSNSSAGVSVSQRPGPVWERLVRYATERGYNACIESDTAERPSKHGKTPVPKLAFGRMDELFRLIGQTRPTRFIGNHFWDGRELPGKRHSDVGWARITKIEGLDEQPMVDLQTSTGTYIAEGFVSHNTTLIALLWLDTALFSKEPIRCGIIAQDKDTAEEIFRDKVRFAYDNLPDELRERMPLKSATTKQLVWAHNGSSIKVATSVRGGTFHRLHVSEFGKICAKYPDKAREVVTGSLPAVPKSGILVIESTAEGQEGPFYSMTMRAEAMHQQRKVLTPKDYAYHFFAWWEQPEYVLPDDADVVLTEAHHKYFVETEAVIGRTLSMGRRKWYVATMDADFGGDQPTMWQEYPSYSKEAFQVSTEGCYYSTQLALARTQGRVMLNIPREAVPVNTFWDIGKGDMTTIWLHQRVGLQNRFIGYYEASGEDLDHFAGWLQQQGLTYGRHYLPHEAAHRRIGMTADTSRTIQEMLETLMPGQRFDVVPVVSNVGAGIQATRNVFASCWFDETKCADGLKRLGGYRKEWDKTRVCWRTTPLHDDNSHGADAFRQFGQEADSGNVFPGGGRNTPMGSRGSSKPRRRSSMAV